MAAAPEQFEGFMILSIDKWSYFRKKIWYTAQVKLESSNSLQSTLKIFEDHGADIENKCWGVCGSDVHTITEAGAILA